MSSAVLPALAGLGYPWHRSPQYKTRRQESVSGKEVRIADWAYPRYTWELTYEFLRQGAFQGSAFTEFAQMEGFFEQRKGGFDSFLYQDPDDNTVTNQGLGTTDGVTVAYQLVRAFGGNAIPVLAPNLGATVNVYLNGGSPINPATYSISAWGAATPGVLTFGSPPTTGQVITADFSYYFPVRFDDDTLTFEAFMKALYNLKKLSFTSIK